MLLRIYLKDTPARQLVGLLYGVAGVLAGLSIVFNVRGLKRLRDEQTDR